MKNQIRKRNKKKYDHYKKLNIDLTEYMIFTFIYLYYFNVNIIKGSLKSSIECPT